MKIPKSHFGTVRDVTKNATAIARAVAAGTSWNAAVGEEFFDTDTVDGLILVGTDDSAFAKQPGFLIGLVLETVWLRVTARAAAVRARHAPLVQRPRDRRRSSG